MNHDFTGGACCCGLTLAAYQADTTIDLEKCPGAPSAADCVFESEGRDAAGNVVWRIQRYAERPEDFARTRTATRNDLRK